LLSDPKGLRLNLSVRLLSDAHYARQEKAKEWIIPCAKIEIKRRP